MPIYAYHCSACHHEMEALQKLSDSPLTECPSCQGNTLKKKVTAAAFRLGGGGWYETDFKNGDKKNLASKDSDAQDKSKSDSADTGSKATEKTEVKPAAKPATSSASDTPTS